jgi:hypothetical protein
VPSWFFGDGAAFLNNVATELGLTNRILPLEGLLDTLGDHLPQGLLFGVRVRRALPATYALEVGIEVVARRAPESGFQSDLIEAALPYADSFTATFSELLAASPFTTPTAGVSTTAATNSTREMIVTAALNADAKKIGGVVPFVTMGGGVVIPSDTPQSSLTLTGAYRFRVNNTFPFDETDRVEIGFKQKTAFVAVIGGGVRWDFSPDWGIRGDVRFLIGPSTTTVTISATPVVVTATPAAFVESFTYPNLQFSNNSSTGRVSTLGGGDLSDFDTFKGGWETRGRVTGGVFFRF